MKTRTKRCLALIAGFCIVLQGTLGMNRLTVYAEENKDDLAYEKQLEDLALDPSVISYADYLKLNESKPAGQEEYSINAEDYTNVLGMKVEELVNYEGKQGTSVLTEERGAVEWKVNVKKAGKYNINVVYYPYEGKSASIQRGILIDGKVPFKEASKVLFSRYWVSETMETMTDSMGNDIRPRQIEKPRWSEKLLKDADGYSYRPFEFYFTR